MTTREEQEREAAEMQRHFEEGRKLDLDAAEAALAHADELLAKHEPQPHRWSGWPGAWCLDCGTEDVSEICIADGHVLPCNRPECQNGPCPEPNSHRHDPYNPYAKREP